MSARAPAKPSTVKWFRRLPPEYYLTATEMENPVDRNTFLQYFDDNHYIIYTHLTWPSQMHDTLLIKGVNIFAIARVLTLLINKFSCICEGQP